MVGILYIVATPIGNLADITKRAIDVLGSADKILAEDTRHSRKLLQHLGIGTKLIPYHEHNERAVCNRIINDLKNGENIALISDAGTPLVSDPGYFLVNQARTNHLRVVPIPGVCALIAALSAAGLPTDRFYFEGFLPAKTTARLKKLSEISAYFQTIILYESSHRIIASLIDMAKILKDRKIVLAKELTKQYEAIVSGTAAELLLWFKEDDKRTNGEFVILIAGNSKTQELTKEVTLNTNQLLKSLAEHLPKKTASRIVADLTGLKKKELYKEFLIESK